MAGFPTRLILLSLLCELTVSAASGAQKELVSALGGSVTFPLNFTGIQGDTIVWTFNRLSLVTIQSAVKDKEAIVIVTQHHNKERIIFPDGGYCLKLSNLKKNDTGVYRAEIHSSSSPVPITQEYMLRVYEHLSRPKVTIGPQDSKNDTCIANLTCSMEQAEENVTYSWKVLGQASNESHDGSILPISWRLGEKNMTFICTVRNPISSNSSSPIFAWKLCRGTTDDPGSSMVFLYILLVPLLLCLLLLVPVVLIMQTHKGKELIENKKRMDIHQEIPNFCPHSGESTVYDTIPDMNVTNPEEDHTTTLYSTVQIPKMGKSPCSLPATPDAPRPVSFENII